MQCDTEKKNKTTEKQKISQGKRYMRFLQSPNLSAHNRSISQSLEIVAKTAAESQSTARR